MTSIIVIGGAGKLGKAIVEDAVRRGMTVTAHVRSAEKAKAANLPQSVKIVEGDGRDAASVAAAIPGHDAVISTAFSMKGGVSTDVVKAAIAGMKAAGVKRLIAVSAYGATEPKGFYGWMLKTLAPRLGADKTEMEATLRSSGLDWTSVQPPGLNDGPATGKVEAKVGVRLKGFPSMPRADVAAFILDEIEKPQFVGKVPVIYKIGTGTA